MSEPIAVLFVDDEPNVLQGIERVVRGQRWDWDVDFATSGQDALDRLANRSFDVVVCDLCMPDIDGAEVLSEVKLRYPSATRIILSGYADEEAVFRAAKVAHRFLHKPCEVDEIRATIDEVQRCHQQLSSDELVEVMGRIDQLPTLGDVYFDLMEAVGSDDWSPAHLAEIVSRDVGLTVELLRLVNSGFFGLTRAVHSVEQAITFLGIDVVRGVVAGYSLFNEANNAPNVDIDEIAARSRSAAILARASVISAGGNRLEAAEAFLAGIVHEVGALALSAMSGVERADLQAALATHEVVTERLVLGADRYSAGAYLLGLWGFADAICQGVAALANPASWDPAPVARGLRLARRAADLGLLADENDPMGEAELIGLLEQLDRDLLGMEGATTASAPGSETAGP